MMAMAMAMAKQRIRALPLLSPLARSLCTAGEKAAGEYKPLFQRLSDPKASVDDTMRWWVQEKGTVNGSKLRRTLWDLYRLRAHKNALELANWMENNGVEITSSIHPVRMELISKVNGVEMAEKYFSGLPESVKDQKAYASLLKIYTEDKIEDKAIAIYEKMKELDSQDFYSNTRNFNRMMDLYMKLGDPKKVFSYFQEMKMANVAPDGRSIKALCYVSSHGIITVERVIEEMENAQDSFAWSMYCEIASCYNSLGDYEKAKCVLKKAEGAIDRRYRDHYYWLMNLYAEAGNLEGTARVWNLLQDTFSRTSSRCYYNFLRVLKILGDVGGIKRCFEEWESKRFDFDVKLVNVVMDAYLSKGMVKEAELLREKCVRMGFGSDSKTLDLFTDFYLERNEVDSALKCLEGIDLLENQCKWKPSKEKANEFLKYFEEAKDVNGEEKFRRILKKLDCLEFESENLLERACG